ncbi:exodeoxyribonuclease V subunit gamma [Acinetobacter qingfengensis]|uniref:RecBCD enzyme subunit RecC n=1 Tax=Acinetobacter qingfengensis TaxID=1262585 RepID=A0A1E7R305_9GAMM|nr:exodeoxyribonuclease V subunit gamma [Acinetobacter qingfengensis]OEY93738.1 hypothetical protein BJI46_04660 [Acinetobacter qingfengensis]
MGIDVLQSQRLEILLKVLIQEIAQPQTDAMAVLQPQWLIVPNHGIGQWVKQHIAQQLGMSGNLQFSALRTAQWQLYQNIVGADVVAKAPQMLNMKWRIFLFLMPFLQKNLSADHALYGIFQRIFQHSEFIVDPVQRQIKQQRMLYWVADHCSRLFSNYMIYRGECVGGCVGQCHCRQNWLGRWGENQPLNIEHWIRQPEKNMQQVHPHMLEYTIRQAEILEVWQRYIWKQAFAEDYAKMQDIDRQFWQKLSGENATFFQEKLPKTLYVFTLLELPPSQLLFLRRLGQYVSVKVLHYTPSQEYWADSVDPKWKAQYALKYPDAAVYYESRHPLLTRLGKQARDISALLSQLAGGEEGLWQDIFPEYIPQSLLQQLQSDILYLKEPEPQQYTLDAQDQSLQIHVCHSSYRQLEVLKTQLLYWLSQEDTKPRQPDDILILVPNLQEIEAQIRTVFAVNYASKQVNLPIKIAGVPPLDAVQLWQALSLRLHLLQQRFSFEQFMDWLSLPAIQRLYGLQFEHIERLTELLQTAGFKRGFDEQHLKLSLTEQDQDYRFSLRYALNRLALGIAMPEQTIFENVLGMPQVQRRDFELIGCLIRIYQDLAQRRDWLNPQSIEDQPTLQQSLQRLDLEITAFEHIAGVEQVKQALDKLRRIIRVTNTEQLRLPLQYLLNEIANSIEHQVGQTEPTGQITFAQMGQLRPLPYRLIVCLNMDTGTFPNRDSHIPFDLMELLRAELGDRSRLEDDQGTFLDAMLQAQDAFWMFYNGFDVNDQQARDPSSIVQELTQHLAYILKTQHYETSDQRDDQGLDIPEALRPLYHIHPLQPFEPQSFSEQRSVQHYPRFQDQWYAVAQHIVQPLLQDWHWLNQLYPDITANGESQRLDAVQWIRDLRHPAQHFLRRVGIQNVQPLDQLESYEPLLLDGLQKYSIRDYLQTQLKQSNTVELMPSFNPDLLQHQLPVGQMQHATWQKTQSELQLVIQRLARFGGKITELTRKTWQLDVQHQFSMTVPEDIDALQWISLTASGCRNDRPLQIWLEYLLWQAAASTDNAPLQRIAIFNNKTLQASGLNRQQAQQQIKQWLQVWYSACRQPFCLPPALFASMDDSEQPKWEFDDQGQQYCSNLDVLRKRWLGKKYYHHVAFNADNDPGCYLSADWQLLFATEQQAEQQFNQYAEKYAAPLYSLMTQHLQILKEESA